MKNKRKIIAIIASLLITVLIAISSVYFNTRENNIEIKSSLKEYNAESQENEHMHLEEDASGDKVPVPNGYVGSKVTGENEIDTGYVIYEGEEEVTDENVEEAQRTRNQYVWIPVPDSSTMYGTDKNGKVWGKIYSFAASSSNSNYNELTGAYPCNWNESNGVMTITNSIVNIEPNVDVSYDIDSKIKDLEIGVQTPHEFLIQLEKEFNNMIDSVERYGGFYIGRYETGDLNQEKVVVRKGNTNIANQNWYAMYNRCKELNNENTNIETGMVWGSQWDRILIWLVESGNKTKDEICNSINWGNYISVTFEYKDSSGNVETKEVNKKEIIPTGSTEYTDAKNIYDLAGNVDEWTLEAYSDWRVCRGDGYSPYNLNTVSHRVGALHSKNTYDFLRLPCDVIYKIIK